MTDTTISHRATTTNNLYSAAVTNDMHRDESSFIIPTNDVELGEEHGTDYASVVVKTKTCYSRWSGLLKEEEGEEKKYSHFQGKPEHVLMIGRGHS